MHDFVDFGGNGGAAFFSWHGGWKMYKMRCLDSLAAE
jgi:hypothetical protein